MARRLVWDQQGGVAILVALSMPVLVGMTMLAVDGGRYFNLHTSLQNGADALALAAAAELDGQSDSITRANRALANVTSNNPSFGTTGARITAGSVRFLKSLPASDAASITSTHLTTDPKEAAYVEVQAAAVGFKSYLATAASMVGGPSQATATAVAGFDSAACNIAPLFMCNPFEGSSESLFVAGRDPAFKKRLISVRKKGSSVGSGNYGFLEPAAGTGGASVREALAIDKPKGCYPKSGVQMQTGNIASTAEAMNVRFDMYEGNFAGYKGNMEYRPAKNVRKGYKGAACSQTPDYDPTKSPTDAANVNKSLGLPRDGCFYTGSCSYGGSAVDGRIGDGNWDFEAYWTKTYATGFPNGWSNANRPTRYELYLHEISSNMTNIPSAQGANEKGAPICYTAGTSTLTDDPDRRTFVGAIIDCEAAAAAGQFTGSSGGRVPVVAYAKFFMTEPMDKNDGTIWAEMIDLIEPGTAAARTYIRDSVVLYR